MIRFTTEAPPKSGAALKLWQWFEGQTGKPPETLDVLRPKISAREAGAPRYMINDKYAVFDVDVTLKMKIEDASQPPQRWWNYWYLG